VTAWWIGRGSVLCEGSMRVVACGGGLDGRHILSDQHIN
jgi:hypothetical protein